MTKLTEYCLIPVDLPICNDLSTVFAFLWYITTTDVFVTKIVIFAIKVVFLASVILEI